MRDETNRNEVRSQTCRILTMLGCETLPIMSTSMRSASSSSFSSFFCRARLGEHNIKKDNKMVALALSIILIAQSDLSLRWAAFLTVAKEPRPSSSPRIYSFAQSSFLNETAREKKQNGKRREEKKTYIKRLNILQTIIDYV